MDNDNTIYWKKLSRTFVLIAYNQKQLNQKSIKHMHTCYLINKVFVDLFIVEHFE